MLFRYEAYSLVFESEIECPELRAASATAEIDVKIRRASLQAELDDPSYSGPWVQMAPGVLQFLVDGVGRFRLDRGRHIEIDPAPDADAGALRVYLLGSALGVTPLLRGLLPLHCSALLHSGAAYAFCGDAGAGKSTLAVSLSRRGLPVITDDVGVVLPKGAIAMLHPGYPRIKLWQDAVDYFGMPIDEMSPDPTRPSKYHLSLKGGFQSEPRPLRHVYVLERSDDDRIAIEALTGHQAIGALRNHTYGAERMLPLGCGASNLQACAQIAQRVRVFRFARPWILERQGEAVDALLAHMGGGPAMA